MRTELELVEDSYLAAKLEPYTNNPTAEFIRRDLPSALGAALGSDSGSLVFKGSAGLGRWTDSPWVAVMDPLVTTTTQRGYYVAYLYAASMKRLVLSLQQGITEFRDGMGTAEAKEQLRHGAALIRLAVPEYRTMFSDDPIDLEATGPGSRSSFYEAAHSFGVTYETTLPEEESLVADLKGMVRLYRLLTYRGISGGEDEAQPDSVPSQGVWGIEDLRRYRLHRRIDRNRRLALEAKKVHGCVCEACGFDFQERYGELGRDYIEAHHLVPLVDLPRDIPVSLDARSDFAVLCANCHRMIHRSDAPKDLADFRKIIRTP
jgi:5-methylcytosine-specific restriction protein A